MKIIIFVISIIIFLIIIGAAIEGILTFLTFTSKEWKKIDCKFFGKDGIMSLLFIVKTWNNLSKFNLFFKPLFFIVIMFVIYLWCVVFILFSFRWVIWMVISKNEIVKGCK